MLGHELNDFFLNFYSELIAIQTFTFLFLLTYSMFLVYLSFYMSSRHPFPSLFHWLSAFISSVMASMLCWPLSWALSWPQCFVGRFHELFQDLRVVFPAFMSSVMTSVLCSPLSWALSWPPCCVPLFHELCHDLLDVFPTFMSSVMTSVLSVPYNLGQNGVKLICFCDSKFDCAFFGAVVSLLHCVEVLNFTP